MGEVKSVGNERMCSRSEWVLRLTVNNSSQESLARRIRPHRDMESVTQLSFPRSRSKGNSQVTAVSPARIKQHGP